MDLLNKKEIKKLKKECKERIKCNIQKNLFEEIFNYIDITYRFYLKNDKLYFGTEDLEKEIRKFKNSNLDNIEYLNKFDLYKMLLIDEKIYISKFTVKLYKKDNKVSTIILPTNGNLSLLLENGKFYTLSPNRKFLLNKPSFLCGEFIHILDKKFIIDLIKRFYLKNYFSDTLIKDFDVEDYKFIEIDVHKLDEKIKFYTKKQLVEYICKNTTKYNLNKLSFRVGYTLLKLKPYIKDDDFENLYKFCLSEKNIKYNNLKVRGKGNFCTIIQEYYKYKGLDILKEDINEYLINILKIKEEKICLKKISNKKMYSEFERIRNIYTLKFYKKNLIIPKNINKYLKLPKEFILLRKTKDIIKEASIQKNCLVTYLKYLTVENKITYLLIYYTIYNENRYTIAIEYCPRHKNKFKLKEVKGALNSDAPKKLKQNINKFIMKSNEDIKEYDKNIKKNRRI